MRHIKYSASDFFLFIFARNLLAKSRLLLTTKKIRIRCRQPIVSLCHLSAKLSFILMHASFLLGPRVKKKHTAFTNIDNNFLRDCRTRRVPRCRRKRDDPSIHCDSLFAARTLSILRDLRYYATSSTSNSTLSLRDFGHKFSWAPLSTLTPTLLDLNLARARSLIFAIFFFRTQTKFFSIFNLYQILSGKRKDSPRPTSSIMQFSRENENARHFS